MIQIIIYIIELENIIAIGLLFQHIIILKKYGILKMILYIII